MSDGEKVSYGVFLFVNKMSAFEKGRDVFYGSLKSMLAFFESVEMPIPLRVNPVDHVLDIINTNETLSDLVNDGKNANKSFAQIMRGDLNQDNFSELRKESAGLGLEGGLPGSMATMTRKELALHLSDLYRQSGIFETICAADPAVVPPLSLARQPGSSFGTRFVALLKRGKRLLCNPCLFANLSFSRVHAEASQSRGLCDANRRRNCAVSRDGKHLLSNAAHCHVQHYVRNFVWSSDEHVPLLSSHSALSQRAQDLAARSRQWSVRCNRVLFVCGVVWISWRFDCDDGARNHLVLDVRIEAGRWCIFHLDRLFHAADFGGVRLAAHGRSAVSVHICCQFSRVRNSAFCHGLQWYFCC